MGTSRKGITEIKGLSLKKLLRMQFEKYSQIFMNVATNSLHPSLLEDREIRFRARMLFLVTYSFIVLFTVITFAQALLPIPLQTKVFIVSIWVFQLCSFGSVLFIIQVKGYYWLAVRILLVSLSLIVFAGIAISGGPAISPVSELLLFIPLVNFYLLGLEKGILWTAANILILIAMYLASWLGLAFVQVLPDQYWFVTSGVLYFIGLASIVSLIFVYDSTFTGLQNQQQKSQMQVRYLATHDKLTGIINRAHFYKLLDDNILKYSKYSGSEQLALVYMDLVGFKEVNDRYGHHTGDLVLQKVARNLEDGIRGSDIVARHGGDEFVLLLKKVKDETALEGIANKIAELVQSPIDVVGLELQVFPSMGIAFYPQHAQDASTLEKYADEAMYEAKSQKRDWKIYQGHFSEHVQEIKLNG